MSLMIIRVSASRTIRRVLFAGVVLICTES